MNLLRPRSEARKVRNELTGGIGGKHVEHWDDSQDAYVFASRARVHIPEHGLLLRPRGLLLPGRGRGPATTLHRGRQVPVISGGAFSASGLYVDNWIDILDATQLAIDMSLTSHKWALYTNTLTPDFSVDTAYSVTNESSGTGYTAGGKDLTGLAPTVTESPAGTLMYDSNDQSWASSSITARGSILYADALAGNNLIVAMTFGADFTSTNGTFLIQFNALGIFTFDLTP